MKKCVFPFFRFSTPARCSSPLFPVFSLLPAIFSLSLCFARSLFPLRGVLGAHEIPHALHTVREREHSSPLLENGGGNGGSRRSDDSGTVGGDKLDSRQKMPWPRRPPPASSPLSCTPAGARIGLCRDGTLHSQSAPIRRASETPRSFEACIVSESRSGKKHPIFPTTKRRDASGEPFPPSPPSFLAPPLFAIRRADKISPSCS